MSSAVLRTAIWTVVVTLNGELYVARLYGHNFLVSQFKSPEVFYKHSMHAATSTSSNFSYLHPKMIDLNLSIDSH